MKQDKESKTPEIPDSINKKLKPIKQSIEEYLSSEALWNIVKATMLRWIDSEKNTVVYSEEVSEGDEKVGLILSIASSDWPGMSEACLGVVHSRGYNVWRLSGFVVDKFYQGKDEEVGLIVIYIKPKNKDLRRALFEEKDSIVRMLDYASLGKTGTALLVATESTKVQIMAMVVRYIEEKLSDNPQLIKEMTGPEGETAKFFASRSTEYLIDRTVKQLGDQIINNYTMIDEVRKNGPGDILVENMTNRKEELTCISITGKQEVISVDEVFIRLEHALPGFKRKFDKTFITRDGIKLIRLEITNSNDEFYVGDDLEKIKNILLKCINKVTTLDNVIFAKNYLPGGQEHYARAIIPLLIREFESSNITQIYIAQSNSSEFSMSVKLLIVTAKLIEAREFELQILEGIESNKAFFVANCMPPRTYGSYFILNFDIQADLDIFGSKYEVYIALKKYLQTIFPVYRDFDEGMRKENLRKLNAVKERLKNRDQNLISEIYYYLDGFHRYQAEVEELEIEIDTGIQALENAKKNINKSAIFIKNVPSINKKGYKSTIIAYASKNKIDLKKCVANIMRRFEVTLCKVKEEPFVLIILNLQSGGKALSDQELESVLLYCNPENE